MNPKASIRSVLLLGLLPLLFAQAAFAGSATWNLNPNSGNWNLAANWTPATVPNGAADIATFDVSNTTSISLARTTRVNSIVFNPGASAFTIQTPFDQRLLKISGAGITNNSGIIQNFLTAAICSSPTARLPAMAFLLTRAPPWRAEASA